MTSTLAPLKPGDCIAVVTPSWAGPNAFPDIYELGLKNISELLELKIVEMESARFDSETLSKHPEIRAGDIHMAFADPNIKGIIASIGGEDSIRILPFLDLKSILSRPKLFMGYSDTTTLLSWLSLNGLPTFHGPSVMAGWAQIRQFGPDYLNHVKEILFARAPAPYAYRPFSVWSEGYPNWGDRKTLGHVTRLSPNSDSWHWLQGSGIAEGSLWGGSMEVLEMMKGTRFWPAPNFWTGKILLLETSEMVPDVDFVRFWLRNYGIQDVFSEISAILVGRARGYTPEQKLELDATLRSVVADEFGQKALPIVTNMDFGHTDPQLILPLGAPYRIDCTAKCVTLLRNPLKP